MNIQPLTARTVTDTQIVALRIDAAEAGDYDQIKICDRALAHRGGRGECATVINMGIYMGEVL